MDLSSSSDKTMFSEALTLYLYRYPSRAGPAKEADEYDHTGRST